MSEKIIDRVRKMLAIANDLAATEHERDTALNMAYKTLAHHNLSMADLKDTTQNEPRGGYEMQSFSFPFAKRVCGAVADLFFCFYITGHKVNGTQCYHHFVGKESNAATAMVMSDWIVKSILKEGRKYYKQNTSPECRAFCLGAAFKLRQRVDAMIEASKVNDVHGAGTALVLANLYTTERSDNEKTAMVLYDYKTTKSRVSNVNASAYEAGKQFGAGINLSLQVGGNSDQTKLLG